jgi:adenosylmethionine-8-amino-7-oxononanoate aminotransferase
MSASNYALAHPFSPLTLGTDANPVLMLTDGLGCMVRDSEGNEYIDAGGGLWNTHVGLGNAEIIEAITAQLHRLSYGSLFMGRGNEPAAELATVLRDMAPNALRWVYLTGSGSESTELALRLAVLYQLVSGRKERKKIVYLDESYHGSFAGSISVSGLIPMRELYQQGEPVNTSIPAPNPLRCPPGQSYVEFAVACAGALEEKARAGDVAAFIVEPVLGSAGIVIPPREYFERISAICEEHKILLIVDEVATGFGRTGRWFACEHFGLKPDILLLAKGINSGYLPLGAVLFSEAMGERFVKSQVPLMHGSTYNGHPVTCASALANIAIMRRDGLIERSESAGAYFKRSLEALRDLPCVGEVRGLGLMLAAVLVQEDGTPATIMQMFAIMKSVQQLGVLVHIEKCTMLFCPPLIITDQEIDRIVGAVRQVLSTVRLTGGEVLPSVPAAPDLAGITS